MRERRAKKVQVDDLAAEKLPGALIREIDKVQVTVRTGGVRVDGWIPPMEVRVTGKTLLTVIGGLATLLAAAARLGVVSLPIP